MLVVRLIALVLAVAQLATGAWAVVSPRGWFGHYPGFGSPVVAATPPFNPHLATDAGSGFAATGITVLVAAVWGNREALTIGLVGLATFACIHAAYHLSHVAPRLSRAENVESDAVLLIEAVVAFVLLLAVLRERLANLRSHSVGVDR